MSSPYEPDPRPGDLDPLDEPERWEALVGRIGERAAPLLAERRQPPSTLDIVARWSRPALAAAASLLLLATTGALTLGDSPEDEPSEPVGLAQAVMPSAFAGWITGTSQPSVTELVRDLESIDEGER